MPVPRGVDNAVGEDVVPFPNDLVPGVYEEEEEGALIPKDPIRPSPFLLPLVVDLRVPWQPTGYDPIQAVIHTEA